MAENTEGTKEKRVISRRTLLKGAAFGAAILGAAGAGVNIAPEATRQSSKALGFPNFLRLSVGPQPARAFFNSPIGPLKKYVQPLRGVGPGGIPVAAADAATAAITGVTHYTIDINQFTDQLHSELGPTTFWGYNPANPLGGGVQPQRHLGGIIVAQKGQPIQLTFRNNLPPKHFLPVDRSAFFQDAATRPDNRVSTHLHGGFVPWISDGGPMAWWGADGSRGDSFINNQVLNPNAAPNEAEFYYPNQQSARMLWYHDHAHDTTRLNAYAGIATAYIIRDGFEGNMRNFGLPDFVENGGREIPIIIQDKIFVGPDIDDRDPTWPGSPDVGGLWYPHVYDPNRVELAEGIRPVPDPSVVPEMFGDTMLANGTIYPEATVEARKYRLRVLNACNARFLNLQLYVDDGSPDSITLDSNFNPTNPKGPDWHVIGTEGGFLARTALVPSNRPFNPDTLRGSLITGPAERWDIIVDFSGYAGKKIVLYNDAPAPFPGGDELNDFFPQAPNNPVQPLPGLGPNTRQIMRFNVVTATGADGPITLLPGTDLTPGLDPFLVPPTLAPLPPPPGIFVRPLTLNERFDSWGRLIQLLGTNGPVASGTWGEEYMKPPTEVVFAGSTEVWQIANLTGDTHPIHFHLINCQILSRQPFDAENYDGIPNYTDAARGPDPWELGWKETVKMHPGEVTTVIMRFDLPQVPFVVPTSPRIGGLEYVWHCHILEHEEHDMMRPMVVV